MTTLEYVGTLHIDYQELRGEYRRLLELIQQVKDGKVPPSVITIDLEKLTWGYELKASDLTPVSPASDACPPGSEAGFNNPPPKE